MTYESCDLNKEVPSPKKEGSFFVYGVPSPAKPLRALSPFRHRKARRHLNDLSTLHTTPPRLEVLFTHRPLSSVATVTDHPHFSHFIQSISSASVPSENVTASPMSREPHVAILRNAWPGFMLPPHLRHFTWQSGRYTASLKYLFVSLSPSDSFWIVSEP